VAILIAWRSDPVLAVSAKKALRAARHLEGMLSLRLGPGASSAVADSPTHFARNDNAAPAGSVGQLVCIRT
jgi:hypothetical protein